MLRSSWTARHALTIALALTTTACGNDYGSDPAAPLPPATTLSASGDIAAKVAEFRALLGEPLNGGTAGQQPSGRRELNWDGVPAAFTNTNTFPADFFNVNSKRGIVTTSLGTGLRVSDTDFSDVQTQYGGDFDAFSPSKTFAAIGSNAMDVTFRVAGDTTTATVRGFGVVFSDVDVTNSTRLEFFDLTGRRIATAFAPVRSAAGGHSFVGVTFATSLVARVRITCGQAPVGSVADVSNGGTVDLVVMDDFLYAEPTKP